jgi:ribosomal-protein-alanine N-acetyltransferase
MQAADWHVAAMEPEDAEEVDRLERAVGLAPWGADYYRTSSLIPGQFINLVLLAGGKEGRESRSRGRPLGYCSCRLVLDEVHVYKFAVDPPIQGRGLGKALLDGLLERCRRWGVRMITLEVRPTNFRAIRLYTCAGFTVIGRRRGYYPDNGEDCLVMERRASAGEGGDGASWPR